jgi:26S proteasome regulatory subunit N3
LGEAAFHARIAFCLDTHNEAVKAMRYPPGHKKSKDDGEKAKERNALEAGAFTRPLFMST